MILVDNISKSYGSTKVLQDISFQVAGGEFLTIVGASGAGKSTLLHCLTGATGIQKGKIEVDHYNVNKLSTGKIQEYRRRIGVIFQDYKLLPQKTVFENVAFALEVSGHSKKFINQRTTALLKLVGLEDKRRRFPRQLSGGEKQRTAIARALVHDPDLLIADEPTGNLDPENTKALTNLLKKINKSGTTIILSTHNQEVVRMVGGRVITISGGKITKDSQ